MFVVGLTGGIGSGKTAASDIFSSFGITIVDADIVAREVVDPNTKALKEIANHFGQNILLANGQLDRAKLRQIIFNDASDKKWLENLLHPIIRSEIQSQLNSSESAYTILVSPLLFETSQAELTQRNLLIDVPEAIQLDRATSRDENSKEQIQKIINSQMPRKQKLAKADDVILNDRDLMHLENQVLQMHKFYLELANANNHRS